MLPKKLLGLLWIPAAVLLIGSSGLAKGSVIEGQTAGIPLSTGTPPPVTTGTTATPPTTGTPTTSTGTTGTSGSAGETTGSGTWAGHVYLHRLYELQSIPTAYKRSGSSVVTTTNQHAVLVRIVLPSVTISPPEQLVGVGHDVSVFGDVALVSRSDNGPAPVYEANAPKSGGTSPTTEAGITYQGITGPGHVVLGLTSAAALSGGDVRVTFRQTVQTREFINGAWVYKNSYYGTYANLDLAKLACGDASIDTRRGHGQPNLAGEYPGDPNAPARPINFGNWDFKGGLFVGNMPVLTGDQSGLARAQLYVPSGGAGNVRLATLSLYDIGSPANAAGVNMGVYLPSASDPNLNVGEGVVTWDTKWTSIAPRSAVGSPPDDARDPLQVLTLTGAGGDYRNIPLHRNDSLPPTMALSRICLAMTGEDVANGPFWRYFGSKEYAAGLATFPGNDSGPRVWRLGEESVVAW